MTDINATSTIVLFYGHVASNLGDLAINRGEIALFRLAFPNAKIRVVLLSARRSAYLSRAKISFGPTDSVDFVHFRSDDKLALRYVLDPGKFLDDCGVEKGDLVALAAGEHLFHYADHENYKNLFWRTLPAFAARQRGHRCLIMPSTFGPFENRESASLMRALFASGPRSAARDAGSISILAESGPGIEIGAALDPAFFITTPKEMGATDTDASRGERVIGLVMRSEGWGLRLTKKDRESSTTHVATKGYHDSLAFRFGVSLAQKVLDAGARLRVFVQTEADKELSEAIVAQYSDTDQAARVDIFAPKSVDNYLEEFGKVDGVVASRFHALVLSLVAARPCFGVYFEAHGHKTPGLFDLLGRSDLCLNLSTTDPNEAAEAALNGLKADHRSQVSLRERLETLRQETLDWITAEWNVDVDIANDQQFTDDLRAMTPIAIPLWHEAEQTARIRRNQFSELKTRLDSLGSEIVALKKELGTTKEQLTATEQREKESRRSAKEAERRLLKLRTDFDAETSRLADEVQAARSLIAIRDRDLSVLRTKAAQERRLAIERAEEAAKARDELIGQVEELARSESFRIGHSIVRVAKPPVRLLSKLWGRRVREVPVPPRQIAANDEPEETSEPIPILTNHELEQLYSSGGVGAVAAALTERSNADPQALGAALVRTSRQMTESGNKEAEFPLVRKALELDRSDQTLRAMFWAAQRHGKIREAWNCLTEIEELYGLDPTPTQRRWLTKARAGAIMNLALLDEIVLAPAKAFVPKADHICYVLHNSLPYSSGGYATRAHGLARGLLAVGIEATCITRPGYPFDVKPDLKGTALPLEDIIDGIRYTRLWEPVRGGSALARYVRGAADALEFEYRKFRPALVMAASAHLSALPALIAARRLGLPFIYEVRGFWEITRLSRQPDYDKKPYFHVMKVMEAEIANHADHVFTLTAPMREELVQRGVSGEKISLLPNSCDPTRFRPRKRDADLAARLGIPADVPVIGYVGTFVQYEGLEDLARACALLRARGMVFRLMLVGNEDTSNTGPGRITGDIQRIAAEQGFTDWLIMPGRVPHDEVEAYYSLIDIAPFPRKPQPVTEMVSPMKPLEALSMEKAVVVSSVRALAEFISDGDTGLIFEKGNVESMADSFARLISDPELRARLGRNARAWVARERTWLATAAHARKEIERLAACQGTAAAVIDSETGPASPPSPLSQPSAIESDDRDKIFEAVRKMYAAREMAKGKVSFSSDDWQRTRLAFEMLEGARTIVDIGIGQAQLVNLLARCLDVRKIHGFDFRNYTTRIDPPADGRYHFRVWNITRPLDDAPEPVDVVVAMEVLEHINAQVMPKVFERLRAMSLQGAVLITVPYREKEPLYHHDKPHGHKQSFDDAKIEKLFGPGCIYTNYKKKWYFILVHDALKRSEVLTLDAFCERVQTLMHRVEIESDYHRQASPAMR